MSRVEVPPAVASETSARAFLTYWSDDWVPKGQVETMTGRRFGEKTSKQKTYDLLRAFSLSKRRAWVGSPRDSTMDACSNWA